MSTHTPRAQDGIEALHNETDPRPIPQAWLDNAPRADVNAAETEYHAVLHTIERSVAGDTDVLAGHKQGRAEQWTIHVLFVRGDGQRRVEQAYDARVVETADGLQITPRGLRASIAVDGRDITPVARPRTTDIERALRDLHDIDVESEVSD
ncbi:hypothetical protein [Halobacterium sp. BOL4-2]|uniref:hypothetical protein n=1 Tax=Halobacterium sp. BOL4-2 TaxID=2810537 RepID=UPI0019659155|nr:hypothetical protein [Halobacterium sp. BOL4-2]QRY26393.1 hypothetical protein JRZ79_13160 [Halobacterium sp. BOL4-2]